MMYEPEYVETFEAMVLADDGPARQTRVVACEASTDTTPRPTLAEAIAEFIASGATEPVAEPSRTADGTADSSTVVAEAAADDSRPADPAPGTSAAQEQPGEALSFEQLLRRAVKMFCGGREQLVASGGGTAASELTLALIMAVKAVVTDLFKPKSTHLTQICSNPERPDLRLAQEEALGHLVGSLVVGEMLATEARPVGKRLDFHAGKEAKAQAQDKESARQKKKGLKKKGLTPEELAEACEAVDQDAAAARMLRLATVIDLNLPPANSQIVERRTPKPDPIALRRRALNTMLGSQLAYDAILAAERVESAEQDLAEFDDDGRNPVYEETSEDYASSRSLGTGTCSPG